MRKPLKNPPTWLGVLPYQVKKKRKKKKRKSEGYCGLVLALVLSCPKGPRCVFGSGVGPEREPKKALLFSNPPHFPLQSPAFCVFAPVSISSSSFAFVSMFRDGCLSSFRSSFLLLVPLCYASSPAWVCRFGSLRFPWGLSGGPKRPGLTKTPRVYLTPTAMSQEALFKALCLCSGVATS